MDSIGYGICVSYREIFRRERDHSAKKDGSIVLSRQ